MDKKAQAQRGKLYALIGLSILMVGIAYFRFFWKPRLAPVVHGQVPASMLEDNTELPEWVRNGARMTLAGSHPYQPPRRDIFAPVSVVVETLPSTNTPSEVPSPVQAPILRTPRLSAIMQGAGRSQAIIDGKIVSKGDRVGEYTVTSISKRQVVLTSPSGSLTLTVSD